MKDLPETSRRVLKIIEDRMHRQNKKGLVEYGQTIDDAQGYDWTTEALAESVDAMQYMMRHIKWLEEENENYKNGTEIKNLQDQIERLKKHVEYLEKEKWELRKSLDELSDAPF